MIINNFQNIVLHAPRINTGGGLVILKSFINEYNSRIRLVNFDGRLKEYFSSLNIPSKCIKPNIFFLLIGEYQLYKNTKRQDLVISWHGLPPIFQLPGRTIVFLQNRLLFEPELFKLFPIWKRFKFYIERLWLKIFSRSSIEFVVQTPSMAELVKKFLGKNIKIKVVGFCDFNTVKSKHASGRNKTYDFVYIASGEPHKNHLSLINAWLYLSKKNIKPSLALTICEKNSPELAKLVNQYTKKYNLNIINVGYTKDISELLLFSNALLFPSLSESLGLPLLEANLIDMPIIASEKDFVRDVVIPKETFDPLSYISIARAVMRFIQIPPISYPIIETKDIYRVILS